MNWMVNAEEQEHSNSENKEKEATESEECWSQYISNLHTVRKLLQAPWKEKL